MTDNFGNAYYVLKAYKDEDIHFLQGAYSTVEKEGTVKLTLHNGFSINDFLVFFNPLASLEKNPILIS